MNAYATASRGYTRNAVLTASPGRLVVMLYDGALRFLFQSATAIRQGQFARGAERMSRAEAIIDELLSTLDLSAGEVAERLQALYFFCKETLLEARLHQDPAKVEEVSGILRELRDAWAEIAGP
jgi:flagellar protein FliS